MWPAQPAPRDHRGGAGRRVVGVVLKNAGAGQLADLTASAVRRLGLRPDAAPARHATRRT